VSIPDIKRILYATDLSENSPHVFGYAADIADRHGAAITILHVLQAPSDYVFDLSSYLGEDKWAEIRKGHEQEARDLIDERLATFRADAEAAGRPMSFDVEEVVVCTGNAVEEIVQRAEDGGFDLVVMGSHGYSSLEEALIGTIARRVVRRSSKPVLLVRLPA
jgi:nucleotide-binding universal stress UspA family protein